MFFPVLSNWLVSVIIFSSSSVAKHKSMLKLKLTIFVLIASMLSCGVELENDIFLHGYCWKCYEIDCDEIQSGIIVEKKVYLLWIYTILYTIVKLILPLEGIQ